MRFRELFFMRRFEALFDMPRLPLRFSSSSPARAARACLMFSARTMLSCRAASVEYALARGCSTDMRLPARDICQIRRASASAAFSPDARFPGESAQCAPARHEDGCMRVQSARRAVLMRRAVQVRYMMHSADVGARRQQGCIRQRFPGAMSVCSASIPRDADEKEKR